MRVEFHAAAAREVEGAQAWYEARSLFAASAFSGSSLPRSTGFGKHRRATRRPGTEHDGCSWSAFRSRSTTASTRRSSRSWPLLIRSAGQGTGSHDRRRNNAQATTSATLCRRRAARRTGTADMKTQARGLLLETLQRRFEKNTLRHEGIAGASATSPKHLSRARNKPGGAPSRRLRRTVT